MVTHSSTGWRRASPARDTLPAKAGVYVILLDGLAVYVGQSLNLQQRFAAGSNGHGIRYGYAKSIHTPWGVFPDNNSDDCVTCRYRLSKRHGDILMWEARLIMKLQPRFNKRGKSKWAA